MNKDLSYIYSAFHLQVIIVVIKNINNGGFLTDERRTESTNPHTIVQPTVQARMSEEQKLF